MSRQRNRRSIRSVRRDSHAYFTPRLVARRRKSSTVTCSLIISDRINVVNWHDRVDSTQLDTQRSHDSVAAVGCHNHLCVCVPCVQHLKYVHACDIYVRSTLTTTAAVQQNILSASARYLCLQYLSPS